MASPEAPPLRKHKEAKGRQTTTATTAAVGVAKSMAMVVMEHQRGGSSSTSFSSPRDLWDRMFVEAYRADVSVHTNEGVINAHASVLGMASPVMKNMLKLSKKRRGRRMAISIKGVPHQAVHVFLRFIYSSSYQKEKMDGYIMPLLVLSHVFAMPTLKNICTQQLETRLLNCENVVDIYQMALQCDTPRLCLVCRRMIVRSFKRVSMSDGWRAMRQSNPRLEKDLLDSVVKAEMMKEERGRRMEERKIYMQLHEAMEALVHICRDGCRTIGPHDKVLKAEEAPCSFPACKGIESLIRHFAGCNSRVSGGCIHCKRMWQLLELHSRLCEEAAACRVPLCRQLKKKLQRHSKKDEMKWRLLASKVMAVQKFYGTLPSASYSIALDGSD